MYMRILSKNQQLCILFYCSFSYGENILGNMERFLKYQCLGHQLVSFSSFLTILVVCKYPALMMLWFYFSWCLEVRILLTRLVNQLANRADALSVHLCVMNALKVKLT